MPLTNNSNHKEHRKHRHPILKDETIESMWKEGKNKLRDIRERMEYAKNSENTQQYQYFYELEQKQIEMLRDLQRQHDLR